MKSSSEQCRLLSLPIATTNEHVNRFRILGSNNLRAHTSDDQFKHSSTGDSVSGTYHDDQDSSVSDCESGICGTSSEGFQLFGDGLIKVDEGDRVHEIIKGRFISGLGAFAAHTNVVAIHRIAYTSFTGQARLQSFNIFSRAMEKKCGGSANVKYAWYGASKDEITKIIAHGFGHCEKSENTGLYGCCISLSPDNSPIGSVQSSIVNKDGVRHLLLCRVLLGKTELVHPGSGQCHPSSEEFDSGADNLPTPNKYIVWSTHMNTHILPEYVVSFKAPHLTACQRIEVPMKKPNSPWMPFPTLISVLSNFLPLHSISLMTKYYRDHKEKKISRYELIRQVRQLAGDKLLAAVIKSYRNKQLKSSPEFSPSNSSNKSQKWNGRNGGSSLEDFACKSMLHS